MKDKASTKTMCPWSTALHNGLRFELKDEPPLTEADILTLRDFIKKEVPAETKKGWVTHLYKAAQVTMCRQCKKKTLSLKELCRNLILLQDIVSDSVTDFEPMIFYAWLGEAKWVWHRHFDLIADALTGIYHPPLQVKGTGWSEGITIALMAKTSHMAEKSRNASLKNISKILKFLFIDNEAILQSMEEGGIPWVQVHSWLSILRKAEIQRQS